MSSNEFQSLTYDEIYDQIIIGLKLKLPHSIMQHKPEFEHSQSNRLRIYLNKTLFPSSHYEICFRQSYYEFALHFESTKSKNLERCQSFDVHLNEISNKVGRLVRTSPFEPRGDYMRVWYEHKRIPIGEKEVTLYTDEYSRFMISTYPILASAYQV